MRALDTNRMRPMLRRLMRGQAGRVGLTPAETQAEFMALTGVTMSGIYLCRETSGSLADVLGGTALAATGSPAYQQLVRDRLGVRYPAGAGHGADVHALGTGSGWYAAVFRIADLALGLPGIVGRINAAFPEGLVLYSQIGGVQWTIQVRDAAAGQVAVSGSTNIGAGTWLGQMQIDQSAAVVRGRMSRIGGGVTEQISASISGFLTLDGAAQKFGPGAPAGAVTGGAAVSLVLAATGVQCEGSTFMANMARNLGVE